MASALLQLILPHLLAIVGFGMAALLIGSVLRDRRPTGSTFAWLLAIVLIPYVGVPLYLVFGGRKIRQRAAKKVPLYTPPELLPPGLGGLSRMLCGLGAPPPRSGNRVELLRTGEEAFAAIVALIDGAQRSVHVSTLVLAGDAVGDAIVERLAVRAEAGVEVRVLVDALFGFRTSRRHVSRLKRAGAKIAFFMPVLYAPFRSHLNLRLHRKIVTADGHTAIVGGMNIAQEYIGPTPSTGRWRDLSARLRGPAVDDIEAVFLADWRFAAGEKLPMPLQAPPAGDAQVQVVASGPDVASDLLYDAFLTAVFEATERIWIATPYFVPDEVLTKGLVLAVRRGVDVRILVPARSNHLTADLAGASHLRQLAEAGGQIFCYQPGMMHAKVVLVDDELAVLGSANLDMRSLFLNYEIAMFFTSETEVETLAGWFRDALPTCGALLPAGRARAGVEAVARLLGPLE